MSEQTRLRPLQPGDYEAISHIAGLTPGFSVPTKYMVWMLATTQGEFCRVAIDQQDAVVGYTLGMQTSQPDVGFSWQTAVLPEYRTQYVAAALVAHITKAAKANGMTTVHFTCTEAQTEALASLVSASGIGEIKRTDPIPSEWEIDEVEVRLRLV